MKDRIVPILVIAALVGGVYVMFTGNSGQKKSTSVDVRVPALSQMAGNGQQLFKVNCAQCHGESAGGTRQGPPLVHKYYRPDHHADAAFYRAATNGVIAHHWNFGNMPPIRTVSNDDLAQIVTFIREVQKANGIF